MSFVLIVGRPNVGKSTLFNRLIGQKKALVRDIPGLTRDLKEGYFLWQKQKITLFDSAGFEFETTQKLGAKTNQKIIEALQKASLILLTFDVHAGLTFADQKIFQLLRDYKNKLHFVINKVDAPRWKNHQADFFALGIDEQNISLVSAESNQGIHQLKKQIAQKIDFEQDEGLDPFKGDYDANRALRVAIIGRPNVGKSSLMNALLGFSRVVVDDTPGTTRDTIDSHLVYKDQHLLLMDTAGIRRRGKTEEVVEKFSVVQALKSIQKAHLTLFVVDASQGITAQDAHVVGEAFERSRLILLLLNKVDLLKDPEDQKNLFNFSSQKLRFLNDVPRLFISAKNNKNIAKIFPKALELYQKYQTRVSTGQLNQAFDKIVKQHPLPTYKGQELKFYYVTQTRTKPPTFAVFCNYPKKVHFSYERYLKNELKKQFDLQEIPLRIDFRERKKK